MYFYLNIILFTLSIQKPKVWVFIFNWIERNILEMKLKEFAEMFTPAPVVLFFYMYIMQRHHKYDVNMRRKKHINSETNVYFIHAFATRNIFFNYLEVTNGIFEYPQCTRFSVFSHRIPSTSTLMHSCLPFILKTHFIAAPIHAKLCKL